MKKISHILSVAAVDSIARLHGVSEPCQDERRALRELANAGRNCPVVVVAASAAAPKLMGDGWHYETKGGTVIRHPGAYAKKGWSNCIYKSSTIRVEVGAAWLVNWRLNGGAFLLAEAA